MTRTSLLVAMCALTTAACGLSEPTRVPSLSTSANPPQRFALTSASQNGWSLTQHAAVASGEADFTLSADGCRGVVIFEINSTHLSFCRVGTGFGSVDDVPVDAPSDCSTPSRFSAGGSSGRTAIGDGYVVLRDGQPYGQLRVVDHTLVPGSWDGSPAQVTLEFTSQRATP